MFQTYVARWRHGGLVAALAACLVGSAACREPAQPTTGLPNVQPAIPVEIQVTVAADRIDPNQLVLDAGEAVRVEVVNDGPQACEFYVGEYLSDLEVPAGGQAEMAFIVPNLPGPPDAPHSTTTFGCADHAGPTGNVVVMPRPSA